MNAIIEFLNRLEKANISYKLSKSMDFSITILIDVPGERWEVDYLFENESDECSGVWVERFKSDGYIHGIEELDVLFRDFSD
jgi:hypothetical protein